ncbi:hypothetical protein [Falsiruegeria litorea]|nr:hypothetical protein [Falsiruegeria litorea]
MRALVRTYLAVMMSLQVMLTGQAMAATSGMDAAVGHMVICTSTGPVVVMVDENGQPTKAPAYCPDYAMSLLGAVLPDTVSGVTSDRGLFPEPDRITKALISRVSLQPSARAPPVTI